MAAGLLASSPSWLKGCEGAVLWGPYSGETLSKQWGTQWKRQREIRVHRLKAGTFLATDYFDVHPGIEELIGNVNCNIRLARGSNDDLCTREELALISNRYCQGNDRYNLDIVEINGAKHLVRESDMDSEGLGNYYDALFGQISSHESC
jgi:hypothetical protein